MRNFIIKLGNLTYFSHRQECNEILKETEKTDIIPNLEKLDDLESKLNSKYDESISAILDYIWDRRDILGVEEYNQVHDTLFKYKSKILK